MAASNTRFTQNSLGQSKTPIDSDHGIYRDLRNVVAKYAFERSHRFPVIQPNSPPQRLFAFELPTASEFFGASQTILIVARAPAQGPRRHRQALHQAMSGHLKRPRDSNELGEFHRWSRSS